MVSSPRDPLHIAQSNPDSSDKIDSDTDFGIVLSEEEDLYGEGILSICVPLHDL